MYLRHVYGTDLDQVSGDELGLSGRDQVIQNLPPLPQAKLHDISIDRGGVVGWGEPCEENTVLRAIGCEAPWWSKKHQRFWGTQRRACGAETLVNTNVNMIQLKMLSRMKVYHIC